MALLIRRVEFASLVEVFESAADALPATNRAERIRGVKIPAGITWFIVMMEKVER